jgi:NTE family protein
MMEQENTDALEFKTGIVLSGGAARGFAHAGVLQALNEEGIFPDVVSGVSAGAIVGAFYCAGYNPEEILKLFSEKGMLNLVKPSMPKHGFFKMTGLEELLEEHIPAKTFEELNIPLYITATNFHTGQPQYFHSGLLAQCVVASSSIPIVFLPTIIDQVAYLDGGLVDNLPIEPIRGRCEQIIGVHVNPIGYVDQLEGMSKIAERAFHLAVGGNLDRKIPQFDIFIEPMALRNYGLMDVKKGKEMFGIGYRETKKILAQHRKAD